MRKLWSGFLGNLLLDVTIQYLEKKLYARDQETGDKVHTCGKDDVSGDQFVIHNRELRQLDSSHPCDSAVSALPIEFDIIRSVPICSQQNRGLFTDPFAW